MMVVTELVVLWHQDFVVYASTSTVPTWNIADGIKVKTGQTLKPLLPRLAYARLRPHLSAHRWVDHSEAGHCCHHTPRSTSMLPAVLPCDEFPSVSNLSPD